MRFIKKVLGSLSKHEGENETGKGEDQKPSESMVMTSKIKTYYVLNIKWQLDL